MGTALFIRINGENIISFAVCYIANLGKERISEFRVCGAYFWRLAPASEGKVDSAPSGGCWSGGEAFKMLAAASGDIIAFRGAVW